MSAGGILTLVDALTHSVRRHPDRPAFRCREAELDFRGLERRARALAAALVEDGVRPGDLVGICLGRCLETPVAVYGILLAGAAFVPIDPQLPAERMAGLLEEGGFRRLVTADERLAQLMRLPAGLRAELRLFGPQAAQGFGHGRSWLEMRESMADLPSPEPDDVAYIMYTSGSTGRPKGIMHTHASGLAYARAAVEAFGVTCEDRLSGFPPLHFDQSTFHIFSGVLAGAAAIMVPDEFGSFPVNLARLIAKERISIWYSVPFILVQLETRGVLEEHDLGALRWIKFGGEVFPAKYLAALMRRLPGCRFANIYGPAEVNQCTHHVLDEPPAGGASIPIGKPWSIARVRVVDSRGNEAGPGGEGELWVATTTMMRGYRGRPDLDAACFVDNGERWYRTGDLVRRDADGVLEFLGRQDRQVKTRGYRVELDEIEAALLAHPDIREAAVYTVPGPEEERLLEAAIIPVPGAELAPPDVMGFLQARLARYAIPGRYRFSQAFPRTGSGKIDRRLLAAATGEEEPA